MASKDKIEDLYSIPAVVAPSLDTLSELAKECGFTCEGDDLMQFKEHIDGMVGSYNIVDKMVELTLPVKFPRLPGYKPEPSENKLNAWYWKCDIPGASEGLLKGKTVAIKDNICVAGVPMTNGSRIMEGFVPEIDATVVTRILEAGGRVVGKTNCENLCFSGSSWTNDTGPILNPHDLKSPQEGPVEEAPLSYVQTGEADMAIGGDQGGSVRMPASWTGIVGLKPTWGLVPYTGAVPIEITCDHLGPMTRTVSDCALLLEAIAGRDGERDPRQLRDLTVPKYSQLINGEIHGMKIGLVTEGFSHCDQEVQNVVKDAAKCFKMAEATVEEFSLPEHDDALAVWSVICMEGSYQCMVKGNGPGYFYKGYYSTSILDKLRTGYTTNSHTMSDPMKVLMMFGKYVEKKYGNKFYAKGQNLNMKMTAAYDKALEKYDVIIMPTLPYKAPLLPGKDATVTERLKNALGMVKNTAPFDITGHPALTITAGTCDSLPIGMMIVGKQFDEVKVMNVARVVEKFMA